MDPLDLISKLGFGLAAAYCIHKSLRSRALARGDETIVKRYAMSWEARDLPDLATNLATRHKTPEQEFHGRLDPSRIPRTFNPQPTLLHHYFRLFPQEEQRLYTKLEQLVQESSS